jgi:RNA polymerase sigma-70 factor, ECF subfamily
LGAIVREDVDIDDTTRVAANAALQEEQLLTDAVRSGDRESFRVLYENNIDAVARFLSTRVPRSDVDDLVAEVFLRAWKSRLTYESRGYRYLSWLLRIATNLVISNARRPIRETAGLDGHDSLNDDPADRVVDQLTGRSMQAMLEVLPERQRTVLELRFLEDLSSSEVGEIMGLSGEAVRQLTVRALRQIRGQLNDTPK